ncbi:PAS domain-containing protein [Echinicola marina]|uniref:PAS domain-containing protein n=1 Tax=Echinicola marina TaxID=2859768 RepID=UPI001CF6B88A|nr:PAS domain-containing protein [Echinicola marina]UCS92387.1 PAS domain-containing protein [Echinicola marina]
MENLHSKELKIEFTGLLEYSPFPMWIYDIDSLRFLEVNDEAVSHYGYSRDEFLAMTLRDIRPKEELPKLELAINAVREGGSPLYRDLYVHRKKDGSLIKVLIRGKRVIFKGKKAEVITAVDKTERFNLTQEIETQRSQLQLLDQIYRELMKSSSLTTAIEPLTTLLCGYFSTDLACFLKLKKTNESGVSDFTIYPHRGTSLLLDSHSICLHDLDSVLPGIYSINSKEGSMFSHLWECKDNEFLIIPIRSMQKTVGFFLFLLTNSKSPRKNIDCTFISTISSQISHSVEKWMLYKQLREREEKFRTMVQEGTDLIAVLNEQAQYTYVSPTSNHVLGIDPVEFIGKNAFEFIHPEDKERVGEEFKKVFTNKHVKISPFRFRHKDGQYRWIETTLTNMFDLPSIQGIVANSMDVTAFKLQAEEINMVNERYRLATLASKDHIYDVNLFTGEAIRMGKAMETSFGYVDKVDNTYHIDFWKENIHPDDRKKVLWRFEQFIKNKNHTHLSLNYRLKRSDGTYAIVVDYCSAIRDENGLAMRIVGIVRDITKSIQKDRMDNLKFRMSTAISQPGKLTVALKKGMKEMLDFTGLDLCEIWIKSKDGNYLDLNSSVYKNPKFKLLNQFNKAKKGEGFPGAIWESGKPLFWSNLGKHLIFKRSDLVESVGLDKGIGIPIIHENEIIGVFLLFSSKTGVGVHEWQDFLFETAKHVGSAIKHKIFETEMETFFNISSNLFAIVGFDGKIKKVNTAFSKLFKNKNIIGEEFGSLTFGIDQGKLQDFLNPDEDHSMVECKCEVDRGENSWVLWKRNISREEKLFFVMGQDISERKKSELALQETLKRLSQAQRIAKLGYWSRNLDEDLSIWTGETYKVYGYKEGEFIPTYENLLKTLHPDDRHIMGELSFEELAKQSPKKYTHRIITASQEVRWVTQTVNVLTDDNKVPYRIEGVIQDITDQKLIEEKLKESNDRFNLALKAIKEMIWDVDHELGMVYRSKSLLEKVNYKEMDKLSFTDSWLCNIDESDREEVWKSFMLVCSDKHQNYWQREYKVKTKQGGHMHVFDRCYIMRDERGMPNRTVGAIEDVSEMKKQMELVQLQNSKLNEIAWKQSHEVRAPLARIMTLVNYLESAKDNQQNTNEILDYIMQSANELDEVIKQITKETL